MAASDESEKTKRRSGALRKDREEAELFPIKEDLAEWLSKTLGIEITAQSFMDVLENGVVLCSLVEKVQKTLRELKETGESCPFGELSLTPMRCHGNAEKSSFYARDNVSRFLSFARALNVQEAVLFASNGLVKQEQPKEVVLTLLDFSRKAAKCGLDPPCLVKMESEIDAAESLIETEGRSSSDVDGCDAGSSREGRRRESKDEVDVVVRGAVQSVGYKHPVKKISEGYYIVEPGGVKVFVRILRSHVMVRVGGGWSTLEHFLLKHVPSDVKLTNHGSLAEAKKRSNESVIHEDPEQENTNPQQTKATDKLPLKGSTPKPVLYKRVAPNHGPSAAANTPKPPSRIANSPYVTQRKLSHQPMADKVKTVKKAPGPKARKRTT